jgi:hypothetical protein
MSIQTSTYSHFLIDESNANDIDLDISSQTSVHLHITMTPNKQSKHDSALSQTIHDDGSTNTYLLFNILLPTTSSTILNLLLPALTTESIMEDSISHSIRFTGLSMIYNMDGKIAILTVIDSLLTNNIKSIIRHTLDFSFPTSMDTPPHTPTAIEINLTPITGFPRYCLIGSCPFHNKKQDLFTDTSTRLQQAQSHGIHLHHHPLSTLNTSTLSSIRWHQCCDTCPTIYLNQSHLDTHRA